MAQPIWRRIVSELRVPEAQKQWSLALDFLTAGKLMMIEVVIDATRDPPETGTWTPRGFVTACSADGDFSGTARGLSPPSGTPLVASAAPGALIARIGGSTADQTLDASTPPTRVVFSVGRRCTFTVPSVPTGSLFLGINDDPTRMADVIGRLLVNIYEGF